MTRGLKKAPFLLATLWQYTECRPQKYRPSSTHLQEDKIGFSHSYRSSKPRFMASLWYSCCN